MSFSSEVRQKQLRTEVIATTNKVWRFVITKEIIHAHLSYNIIALIEQLRGTAPQMKGRSGKRTYI
jgi:hypothetical protein